MKKEFHAILGLFAISCMAVTCRKEATTVSPPNPSLVNLSHLNYLYTPIAFGTGIDAAAIYIYSAAPDYHLVADADEGFACVDDASRAIQVYLRTTSYSSDTAVQAKVFKLIRFVLQMQSTGGYFYNFLFPDFSINTNGTTSGNTANWWSWRALYALSEAGPVVRLKNVQLADDIDAAINKVVSKMKVDLASIPQSTKSVSGITVPQWLPAGSGTDQAAIMILGLIPYCTLHNDTTAVAYIRKLADGIALMQQGDATHFPFSCILSWENTWHAYAGDQALALMRAGAFLNEPTYAAKGIAEVDNFYAWLLNTGMKSSFALENTGSEITLTSENTYDQIAYGIRPLISAALEAYRVTNLEKYADMAGHFAAWFSGANDASAVMYSSTTGRCFDGIQSSSLVNTNSGAESTIEALFAMESVESYPAVRSAFDKYKK